MRGIRITSPGVLLILVVIAAGGIFLVDLLYLRPLAERIEQHAIRDRAEEIAAQTRMGLTDSIHDLDSSCRAAAAELGRDGAGIAERAPSVAALTGASVLAVTDKGGRASYIHHSQAWRGAGGLTEVTDEQFLRAISSAAGDEAAASGVLRVDGEAATYARCRLGAGDESATLWLLRPLAADLPSEVSVVVGGVRPPSRIDAGATGLWLNPKRDTDELELGWPADDPSVGYFLTTTSVRQIRNEARASRRRVLLLLSLSAVMASLLFVGVHILIAGPVYRLMKRLRSIELGDDVPRELTRNLHGEPLVLARRLETAFDKLAEMSRTDELTGLANRRHFTNVLEAFYAQSRRYSRPLSLIVMDVDFLKAVNDSGGHEAGDELLKVVAGAVEDASRKADLPARLGGDEFAILLPETNAVDAEAVAQRIRTGLANQRVMTDSDIRVTLSIGVADLNAGEIDSPESMLSMADRALYAAKDNGRNCVVQAHKLAGPSFANGDTGEQVSRLYKKLAGLDSRFKDLFLSGIEEIMDILETRAPHMADHAHKVQRYATLTAQEMGLPQRVVKRIEIAAMLHDIGMLAMPDSILLSAGKLTSQDLRVVRQHPLISVRIMEGMEFLEQEIPAVRYHHEWFNGAGYPEGIAGSAIPLSARIIAVADAFDAMTSPRSFRQAATVDEALAGLRDKAGRQFDPDVVAAFVAVAERLGDNLMANGPAEETSAHQGSADQHPASPPA